MAGIQTGPKFVRKIFIKGIIEAETGLHIGGSKAALDIGGIDLNVIKTAKGVPFIPGSSLKGKLRTLLAREDGKLTVKDDTEHVKHIFGTAADHSDKDTVEAPLITRLYVRDAVLNTDNFSNAFSEDEREQLETDYTESKWENTIDRKTGTAGNPRQLERVPAGATFDFEMVYNAYDDGNSEKDHINMIVRAMRMLEDDYLGGHGSRGYGQIKFKNVVFSFKGKEEYENDNIEKEEEEYNERYLF